LEKVNDYEYQNENIPASRLGYRITYKFVRIFCARVFENPEAVLNEEMLRPEKQDTAVFTDGVKNIVEAQKRVAQRYFNDGSVNAACPPLKALLYIMIEGSYEGKTINDPSIRKLFTRDYLIKSEWYRKRTEDKQKLDAASLQKHIKYLQNALDETNNLDTELKKELKLKMEKAERNFHFVQSENYLKELNGTIGLDPLYKK